MERIEREILQAVTTGVTACTGTTGTCYVIIPDTGVTYQLVVGLKQDTRDIGFMDAFVETPSSIDDNDDEIDDDDDEESISIPTVITGTADVSGTNPKGSSVETGGLITEYGVIFTSDSSYNSENTLTYNNRINESTVMGLINTTPNTAPFNIPAFIAGINTLVYYRAFAKNSAGIGYGVVKSIYISS